MELLFQVNGERKGIKRPPPLSLPTQLVLSPQQRAELTLLIEGKGPGIISMLEFNADSDRSFFLRRHYLDLDQSDPICKWATQHSIPTRVIRQCQCGIYREAHHRTKGTHMSTARYAFAQCLAFVILTYRSQILAYAQGYLQHSEACALSGLSRLPSFPLNETIMRMAEAELLSNASTVRVLTMNANYVDAHFNGDALVGNERVLLRSKDIANILRLLKKTQLTINTRKTVQSNLEMILKEGRDAGTADIKAATLHYKPRRLEEDRLELILSTSDQRQAAWKHGHQRWIHLDGTFGASKHKVLLFILLVVDDNNKGIPVSYFLFTPPSSNKHTAAGYSTEVLTHLFTIYKEKMTKDLRETSGKPNHEEFRPLVAMTDTDYKERGALAAVWPGIRLLICYFHVRQCWKNEMRKQLGRGGSHAAIRQRQILQTHLNMVIQAAHQMEKDPEDVRIHISQRKQAIEQLMSQQEAAGVHAELIAVLKGGVNFLKYVQSTWLGSLIMSWCFRGRADAASALNLPLERLPTTNNHVEGGNSLLKTHLLPEFQRGGRLLRFDELVVMLVRRITPMILGHVRLEARYIEQLALRRKEYGIAAPINRRLIEREFPQVAFLDDSQARTTSAERLVSQSKINGLEVADGRLYVNVESENPVRLGQPYRVCIYGQTAKDVRCECLDFLSKGGACKHLRAAEIFINRLRLQAEHQHLPAITFINKHQAFLIRRSLPQTPSCIDVVSQDDGEAKEDIAEELDWPFEDDTGEMMAGEQQDEITDEGRNEEGEHEDSVKDLTGLQDPDIIELDVLSNFTGPTDNIQVNVNKHLSITDQNTKAVREQHLTHLHLTTSSFLHQLKTNLRSYQKIEAPETADLISNLENVINSPPYMKALSQVSQLVPKTKRTAEVTGFYPLDVEKKQRRHQSFASL